MIVEVYLDDAIKITSFIYMKINFLQLPIFANPTGDDSFLNSLFYRTLSVDNLIAFLICSSSVSMGYIIGRDFIIYV